MTSESISSGASAVPVPAAVSLASSVPSASPVATAPTMLGAFAGATGSGRVCSVPGCQAAAVTSWQRHGTDDEEAAYWAAMQARQDAVATSQRNQLELQIAELESQQARLTAEGRLTPGAAQTLTAAIEGKRAAHAATAAPHTFPVGPVLQLVLGCDEHAVTGDAATVVHPATCGSVGPCACPPTVLGVPS